MSRDDALFSGETLDASGGASGAATAGPSIWRWRDGLPLEPAGLGARLDAAPTGRLGADGRLLGGP